MENKMWIFVSWGVRNEFKYNAGCYEHFQILGEKGVT